MVRVRVRVRARDVYRLAARHVRQFLSLGAVRLVRVRVRVRVRANTSMLA
jgi:hypothetical protein